MYVNEEEVMGIAGFGCWGVVSLVMLLLTVLYLSTLSKALAACDPARRTLEPGLVWLNLIPLFHLFWKFWTSAQVGTSLRHEFDARGMRTGFTFGRTIGALVPLVAVLSRFIFFGGRFVAMESGEMEIQLVVFAASLVLGVLELVLLIVHWVQISGYTRQLNASRPMAGDDAASDVDDGGARDFDEDYRPITRPRRRSRS